MKKFLIITSFSLVLASTAYAQTQPSWFSSGSLVNSGVQSNVGFPTATNGYLTYTPLEPIPGVTQAVGGGLTLPQLLSGLYRTLVIVCVLFAVVMIAVNGVRYSLSEVVTNKERSRSAIAKAMWGLLIVLGSYLVLYTINPELTQFKLSFPPVTITGSQAQAPTQTPTNTNPLVLADGSNPLNLTPEEMKAIQSNLTSPNATDCTDARRSVEPSFTKVLSSFRTSFFGNGPQHDQTDQIVKAYIASCAQAGF